MLSWIALFLLELTAATYCNNGAGGRFRCRFGMTNKDIALAACSSLYGSCRAGKCGNFRYYYYSGDKTCDCNKKYDGYEFIYKNYGYAYVGSDYGGKTQNVRGNNLFVRKKTSSSCKGRPWYLVFANLGSDVPTPTMNPTASPTDNPTASPTDNPTASPTDNPTKIPTFRPTEVPSRIPCKDEFPWCVFPNICDTDDFRQYCPFSCDDCRTAGPTTMPTSSPTEDCAAREDILEGVIDHMLNHFLKSEEDESSESSE